MDATAEIAKLEKKVALAEQNKAKILKVTEQPSYEKTVKDEVRAQNIEKVGLPHPVINHWAATSKILDPVLYVLADVAVGEDRCGD